MNIWVIVILVITIALVVGPVMMFKPSKRDQRLAILRQSAAQKGIRVRLVKSDAAPDAVTTAVYTLPHKDTESRSEWMILKQSISHDLHFFDHWDWASKDQVAPKPLQVSIEKLLQGIHPTITGIECTRHGVGIWWRENQLSIEDVEAQLKALQTLC